MWYSAVALLSGSAGESSVRDEVTHWFFDDYLPTWVGVAAGTISRDSDFILDYWSAPLNWTDPQGSRWLREPADVVDVLHELHTRLNAAGYTDTAVPDRKVTVYHDNGAAIEVIWARLRGDGTEIERIAAHFELARGSQGWRIIAIQAVSTASDSLKTVWLHEN